MKIFENKTEERGSSHSINFVDENNVFVGYDTTQKCCEDAGWFISEREENTIKDDKPIESNDLEKYTFDQKYFKEVENESEFEGGGMVRFRLVNGDKELFLHLYNAHNGYYGHGFEAKIGGIEWESGGI